MFLQTAPNRLLLSARAAVPEEDSDPNVRYEDL